MIRHTNSLLLEIHQAAKKRDVESFKGWVLERLATLVPFRYAVWLSVPVDFDAPQALYGFGHDGRLTASTQRFSGPILPMIAGQAERRAGETVPIGWDDQDAAARLPADNPQPRQALATQVSDHGIVAASLLVVFRVAGDAQFSKEERSVVEMVAPHLVEAFRTVLLRHLVGQAVHARGDHHATLVADGSGVIHEGDSRCVELLRAQWPGWNGPLIPEELRDFSSEQRTGCHGRVCYQSRPINDELWLIEIWERGGVDVLTPSERRVAALLADGLTYREAARRLGITVSTVTNHANRIYDKLNIRNKAQLAQVVSQSRDV